MEPRRRSLKKTADQPVSEGAEIDNYRSYFSLINRIILRP